MNGAIRLGNCQSIAEKSQKIQAEMETVNQAVTEKFLTKAPETGSEPVSVGSQSPTPKLISPITGKGLPVVLGRDGKPLRGAALYSKLGWSLKPTLGRRWTFPWAGDWGNLKNGLSKLSKLAKRIEKEITDEFEPPFTPFQLRFIRTAAEQGALSEMARKQFGSDPTLTRRGVAVSTLMFSRRVQELETVGGMKRRNRAPADLPSALRQLSEGQK